MTAHYNMSGEFNGLQQKLRDSGVKHAVNTTSVESDFSILKWEMNANRTCMMHLSLEGIFQSKQRALLESMTQ